MPNRKTADLVDAHDTEVRFCQAPLVLYGRRRFVEGTIVTVKTFEDNALLKRTLEGDGTGKVLVVDGGASRRVALIGDIIATIAQQSGWSGVVVNGALRDSVAIAEMDFAVFALARSPKKSSKLATGAVDVVVSFGGVEFVPGHTLYGDDDGILVAARALP